MEEKREFPMTVWPGMRVPVPLLLVSRVRMVRRKALVFGSAMELDAPQTDGEAVELPPEFYLREFLELDASDPGAVLAFCERWGPVGREDCTDLAGLPYAGRYARDVDVMMPEPWSPFFGHAQPHRRDKSLERLGFRQLHCVHSVKRVKIYQDTLRNMILLWRFVTGEIGAPELATECRSYDDGRLYLGLTREQLHSVDVARASFELTLQLNAALGVYHVRIELHLNELVPIGTPLPNVYEAACLQLANHIAERASYRRCANETCGRLFVRQRGGSRIAAEHGEEHGQYHASGVMYCTPQCARAQVARASRRRRRATREARSQ